MAEVAVPALVVARPITDALAWRAARRASGGLHRPGELAIGLVTDGASRVPSAALRDAGLHVAGLLGPDALESIAWAAEVGVTRAYADLPALLSDEIDAIAVDVPGPRCDVLITAASKAGLHVLLTTPRYGDPANLTSAVLSLEDDELSHTVAFLGRADQAYAELAHQLHRLGPLTQLTALGWPAGGPPRAELIDLVRRLCGDVVAVCADPGEMPAAALADDEPVTLALLTESGVTVLASERFAARQAGALITLVGSHTRAVVSGSSLVIDGQTISVGRADAAAALRLAGAALRDPENHPDAAAITDLIAAGRVLQAVERSRVDGGWIELP